jgi:hypothetical protein
MLPLILQLGKVERRYGCHVALDGDFSKNGDYAAVRFACRVPESALTEERWWGDGPKPKVVALDVGDCMLLEFSYYCVEEISRGKFASFQQLYIPQDNSNTVIMRFPRRR